ncbi:MAG: SurA N-terminal domain-containing protein [Haliscomenobacter sp.]|nr:peptidylprolyl isomerase [Haliscomenobacter sp.]MBK9487657.1 SurA N-terminal domain-containing protein [Haliscomenobacter sp.]
MALISTIRKNSALIVVLIALGLLGFIIQDMMGGQSSIFGSIQPSIGKINGQKVDLNEFNRTESILYAGSTGDIYARRSALWDYFVEKALIDQEAAKLGIGVSKNELIDLQFGPEPSPIIMQRFMDQTTGQLNREQLNSLKQQISTNTLPATARSYWAIQEQEILKDRMQTKLVNMVSKGLYTPTWVAEMSQKESATMMELSFARIPFDAVDNAEVSVSDEDYTNYLKENPGLFKYDEEARKIGLVTFEVKPTKADSLAQRDKIVGLINDWRQAPNDTVFVEQNLGTIDGAYVKREGLLQFADSIFNLPIGGIFGPYVEGNAYRAVKLLDRKVIPDSVKSRHILIRPDAVTPLAVVKTRLDSIKNVIETGKATFADMALRFGQDGTATTGGDLGYTALGGMVKPYNDLIFFQAEQGKLYTVETQFGAHLVEVTGKKVTSNASGVRVAYIGEVIKPSKETENRKFEEAQRFLNANNKDVETLLAAAKKVKGLVQETSAAVNANEFFLGSLGSGQQPREIIRWAFGAKKGQVAPDIYTFTDPTEFYTNKYVLAGLKAVLGPGRATADQVKEDIEAAVINRKKGELIAEKLKGKGVKAAAAQYSVKVDTLRNIRFNQAFLPNNVGSEPRLNAYAFKLKQGPNFSDSSGQMAFM